MEKEKKLKQPPADAAAPPGDEGEGRSEQKGKKARKEKAILPSQINNKDKNCEVHAKLKREKKAQKRGQAAHRAEELGEQPPERLVPRTIDNTWEPHETVGWPDEEERLLHRSRLVTLQNSKRMDDREWMYTGRPCPGSMTDDWIDKTDSFLERAFRLVRARATWCPCSICANRKRQTKVVMGKHLCNYGFTPNYTRWIYHGETDRMRDEVVRQRVKYTSLARTVHGPNYDSTTQDLDGEVIVRVEALQVQLQVMRAEREAMLAEREAERRRMAEILQYIQSLGAAMGVAPPATLFAPPPPPHATTPNESAASNVGPVNPGSSPPFSST